MELSNNKQTFSNVLCKGSSGENVTAKLGNPGAPSLKKIFLKVLSQSPRDQGELLLFLLALSRELMPGAHSQTLLLSIGRSQDNLR